MQKAFSEAWILAPSFVNYIRGVLRVKKSDTFRRSTIHREGQCRIYTETRGGIHPMSNVLAPVAHVVYVAEHWRFIEGVRRGDASNEPRAPAERQVLETPLDED